MEHRKFQRRLDELVAELTYAQAQKVVGALQQRGDGDEVHQLIEQRLEGEPECMRLADRAASRAGGGRGMA